MKPLKTLRNKKYFNFFLDILKFISIFAKQTTKQLNKMENTNNTATTKKNAREFMLMLCEVGETMSAFEYAFEMMVALKNEEITLKEFTLLSGTFQIYCRQNKIQTSNEICSLF